MTDLAFRTFRLCFYPAAHLCQNFQQRCIGLRPAAGQFHPTSCRRAGTGKGGCHDAVGHGRKAAAIQHSSALHPDGAGARALYTAAAAVQECCQIANLRFSCGPAQDRLALRRSCCQKQGLGSTHAGEPKCDVRTVAASPYRPSGCRTTSLQNTRGRRSAATWLSCKRKPPRGDCPNGSGISSNPASCRTASG